jgi:hypothetical protein
MSLRKAGVTSMTQLSSFGPTQQFGESAFSRVASVAGWLFSKIRQPDIMIVLAFSAIGLVLMLVAAATLPDFSSSLADAYAAVGP